MSQDRRLLDRQLDRVERMLERCIAADKASRKQRRAQSDVFYQRLEILRKLQEEVREVMNPKYDSSSDYPKH
jgi:hypothetical protein